MENGTFIYVILLLTNTVSQFEKHIYKNLANVLSAMNHTCKNNALYL